MSPPVIDREKVLVPEIVRLKPWQSPKVFVIEEGVEKYGVTDRPDTQTRLRFRNQGRGFVQFERKTSENGTLKPLSPHFKD